jgi:hypothetical protein
MAYFEINNLELALEDYFKASEIKTNWSLKNSFPPLPFVTSKHVANNLLVDKSAFLKGLFKGVMNGTKESLVDFGPSIISSCRGIANGLWAFAVNPSETTLEFTSSAYSFAAWDEALAHD